MWLLRDKRGAPLLWGGSGCARFALEVAVGEAAYEAIYGPGGARHPASRAPLLHALLCGIRRLLPSVAQCYRRSVR